MTGGGRPFDALYDTSYKVSGARDHYREQNRNAGIVLEKLPEYNNMFSKLPNYPSATLRFKANDHIPPFVNREHVEGQPSRSQLKSISTTDVVSGPNRFKYVKRPLLGTASAVPTGLTMQHQAATERAASEAAPRSRTVGTQSLYRESEAQTIPYSPDYVIPEHVGDKQRALMEKHNTDVPEILTLQKLKFGEGLPVGLNEINHIDKLREKRAYEISLPPLHDTAQLPRRRAMMDAWEAKEWAEREREIEDLQEERLGILANALEAREANIEAMTYDRVEGYKERELEKREQVFAAIQKRRIKAVRHLTTARKMADSTLKEKKSIIQKYGDFGSDVYAPLQREGRFPDSKPSGKEIEPEPFVPRTLNALYDLENSAPIRKLEPRVKPPKSNKRLDAAGRKEKAIRGDLDHIDSLLESTKAQGGRGFGDCWPYPLATDAKIKKDKRQRTIVERPSTPVAPPVPVSAKRHAAATLLQRLLRGRAVQNIMYEGKTRRLELIQELRMEEPAKRREAEELEMARSAAVTVGRADSAPRTLPLPGVMQVQDAVVDEVVGEAVVEVMNVLTMEPGEEQTALLMQLMAKYAPPPPTEAVVDEEEAATRIQSLFRGHQARRSVANLQKDGARMRETMAELAEVEYTDEQAAAAVKIQARTRGMLARKQKKTTTTSTTTKKSSTTTTKKKKTTKHTKKSTITTRRSQLSPQQVAALELQMAEVDPETVVKMQAQSRGFLARKKVQAAKMAKEKYGGEEDKIVKVQAQAKGFLARKRVAAMQRGDNGETEGNEESEYAEEEEEEERSGEAAEGEGEADGAEGAALPDLSSFSEEEQAKIVKMQAQGRGYIARKQVQAKKIRGEEAALSDVAEGEGDDGLPDLSQFSEEEQAKIVKMQAQGRGYIARKQVQAKKAGGTGSDVSDATGSPGGDAEGPEVAAAEDLPDLSSFSEEEQAKIVKMQAQGRGYIARKQVQAKKAEGDESTPAGAEEGDVDDGLPDLSMFSEEEQAKIVKMQAQGRGYIARKQMQAKKAGVEEASPADVAEGEGNGGLPDLSQFSEEDQAKIVKMQAQGRGYIARKQVRGKKPEGEESTPADAGEKEGGDGLPDLSQFSEEEQAKIVKMQAAGRGYIARKEVKAKKDGAAEGPNADAVAAAAVEEDEGATELPSHTTGADGLPDLSSFSEEEQAKIVKMQAAGRGYIARKEVQAKKAEGEAADAGDATGGDADGPEVAAADGLPDLSSFSEEEQAKIVKMQAQGRGYIVRKQVQAKKSGGEEAAPTDGGEEEGGDGLPDLSQYTEEEQAKIVKMQAQGRGYIARKQVNEKRASAGTADQAAVEELSPGDGEGGVPADPEVPTDGSAQGAEGDRVETPPPPTEMPPSPFSASVAAAEAAVAAGDEVASGDGGAGEESKGAELPDLSSFSEEDQQKVVKMQAQGRGYIARKQMKGHEEGSTVQTRGEREATTTSQMHHQSSSSSATRMETRRESSQQATFSSNTTTTTTTKTSNKVEMTASSTVFQQRSSSRQEETAMSSSHTAVHTSSSVSEMHHSSSQSRVEQTSTTKRNESASAGIEATEPSAQE